MATSARVEVVSPKEAADYLAASTGFRNRRLNNARVASYAKDMAAGNWELNGETIIFDENANLVNGQHRMHAVIKAGLPVQFMVVRGVKAGTSKTIDQGYGRSIAQAMLMDGKHKNTTALVAAVRALRDLREAVDERSPTGQRADRANLLSTVAEVEDALRGPFAAGIDEFLELVPNKYSLMAKRPEWAAVTYELAQVESQSAALDWLGGMGGGLPTSDPRSALRERLIEDRAILSRRAGLSFNGRVIARTRIQCMTLMIQSWNLWIGDHKMYSNNMLQLRASGDYAIVIPLNKADASSRLYSKVNRTSADNLWKNN